MSAAIVRSRAMAETAKKLWQMMAIVVGSILITGIFWTTWSLFAPVPTVTKIVWSDEAVWLLPFAVSRWWDVLFAPIYALLIASLFLFDKPQALFAKYLLTKKDDLIFGSLFGLIFGLVLGLVAYLIVGLDNGTGAGLVICLVANAVGGVVFGLGSGLGFGAIFGLGIGLAASLIFALGIGMVIGLLWLGNETLNRFFVQ